MTGDGRRDPLPGAPEDSFWGSLTPDDRQALTEAATRVLFRRRAQLLRQGQRHARILLLVAGEVEVSRLDRTGVRTVLARRGPGDVIGEISAVDDLPASATVVAVSDGAALVLSGERFTALCYRRPELTWRLLRTGLSRLRESDDHRTQHRADVRTRLITVLLELSTSGGRDGGPDAPACISITQRDLADATSSSLVAVTRVLSELRMAGVLTTTRGRIVIPDVSRLRALLPR